MRRRLIEQKIDVDIVIVKCLERARLTPLEVHEVMGLSNSDLMSEHDLDYVLADRVLKHAATEALRHQAQSQQSRADDTSFGLTSLTRLDPVQQSPGLTEARVRRLARLVKRRRLKRRHRS
jgi:hypothetical protein